MNISVSKFLKVDFLGQKVCALVILIDTANLPMTEALWIYLCLPQCFRVPGAPYPPPHSVLPGFFIFVNLIGETVSHFIFMSELEHLLMYLNTICISFPTNCLFISFAHFKVVLFVIYWLTESLHVFGKWALCEVSSKYFPKVFIVFT